MPLRISASTVPLKVYWRWRWGYWFSLQLCQTNPNQCCLLGLSPRLWPLHITCINPSMNCQLFGVSFHIRRPLLLLHTLTSLHLRLSLLYPWRKVPIKGIRRSSSQSVSVFWVLTTQPGFPHLPKSRYHRKQFIALIRCIIDCIVDIYVHVQATT